MAFSLPTSAEFDVLVARVAALEAAAAPGPSGLYADVDPAHGQVALHWDAVPGAVSYNVYPDDDAPVSVQSNGYHPTYAFGQTVVYTVSTVYSAGESARSAPLSVDMPYVT